jgi:transposase
MGQSDVEAAMMAEDTLFELPEPETPKTEELTNPRQARVLRPVRNQVEWTARDLDSWLPDDHPARAIWAFLEGLDLSAFYASIKSVLGRAGHPTTDPQVLLALWLYAISQGIGSARQIARLCREHDACRWLCGGVPINYHTLPDFRVAHQDALDQLLTEILAAMMDAGLVKLEHVAQDGMRVRASAGTSSFRRESSLQRCLTEAEQQVAKLAAEREQPDPGRSARQEAARERAARERQQRVEKALRRMPEVQAEKERRKKTRSKAEREKVPEARVSTTD